MASPRIIELASIISTSTKTINDYYVAKGIPSLSFDPSAQSFIPGELSAARDAVIDATAELQDLMLNPVELLLTHGNHNNLVAIHAINRFRIAHSFPVGSTTSYAEIARKCHLDEFNVRRLLRFAMTFRIFHESTPGTVAHTAASAALATPTVHDLMGANCEDLWPAATRTVDALEKWAGTQEPNETGFSLANGSTSSMYQILEQTPARAKRFAGAMAAHSVGAGWEIAHLLDNYDFAALGPNATVVDVGGSIGAYGIAIAERFLNVNVVVQDLPKVVEGAEEMVPEGLKGRVRFDAHDFFEIQTVKAEVYYCRWIFHNWSDKYCVQILKGLVPAMENGARVLIHDAVLEAKGKGPSWRERQIRAMDVTMLEILNAREREAEEWEHLFQQADSRFKFLGVRKPEGSNLSIIEAVWEESHVNITT